MSTWKGLVLTRFYCCRSDSASSSFHVTTITSLVFPHMHVSLSLNSVKAKAQPNTIQVNFRNVYIWLTSDWIKFFAKKWILFCRLYTTKKTTALLLFCTSVSFMWHTAWCFHIHVNQGESPEVINYNQLLAKCMFALMYRSWCSLPFICYYYLPNTFHEVYVHIFIRDVSCLQWSLFHCLM